MKFYLVLKTLVPKKKKCYHKPYFIYTSSPKKRAVPSTIKLLEACHGSSVHGHGDSLPSKELNY